MKDLSTYRNLPMVTSNVMVSHFELPPISAVNTDSQGFITHITELLASACKKIPEIKSGESEVEVNILLLPVVQCKLKKH